MADRAGIITAAPVQWSNGQLLDGYLLLGLSPPPGYSELTKSSTDGSSLVGVRVPLFIKVPIRQGKLDTATKVWFNSLLDATGSRYFAFWYSGTNTLINSDITPYDIEVDPFTIVPPTLTAPASATSPPLPDTPPGVPPPVFIIFNVPTQELPSGTQDGVNVTFTVSHAPLFLVLTKNGAVLDAGIAYTRVGATITFLAGYIPQPTDLLLAFLWD